MLYDGLHANVPTFSPIHSQHQLSWPEITWPNLRRIIGYGWIISKKNIFFGFSVHILALILSIGSPSQVKRLFRMSIRFKPHRNIRKLTLTFSNPLRKTQKLFTYVVAITFFHDVKCAGTASLDHKIPIKTHNCALFNTCNSKSNYYIWNICTYLNLLSTFISIISKDYGSIMAASAWNKDACLRGAFWEGGLPDTAGQCKPYFSNTLTDILQKSQFLGQSQRVLQFFLHHDCSLFSSGEFDGSN